MLPARLSKEEKKALMLTKYVKRDAIDVDDFRKFAVYWQPLNKKTDAQKWLLITICDTFFEAKDQIRWRAEYHQTNDGDLVLDNDKRFKTFRDETQNKDEFGETIEPGAEDMVGENDMGETFAESLPTNPTGKFRSAGYYAGIELEYRGYYKIDEIYDVHD